MKKIFYGLLILLSKIIRKDKKLITLLFRGYSGSNISPIMERFELEGFKDYKIVILTPDKQKFGLSLKERKFSILKDKYKKYKYVFKSQLVISTHGMYRLRNDNYMINLWHGVPLKAMSLMNKSKSDKVGTINDDFFISTSEFYNTLMNACLGIRADKYYITGYPRNDYLFNENGLKNLELLTGRKIDKKIILYMPTFRDIVATNQETEDKRSTNYFGYLEFNFDSFNDFVEKNNLLFILKLHPNEEKVFIQKYSDLANDNIILLKGKDLEEKKMDLYKILNAVDLIITDYSSVYFDYLLLDRPMLFIPSDIEEYRKTRGILLEPYDFWTPGPKCINQDALQKEVIKSLNSQEYYKEERRIIRNIIHKYQDGSSTERVMKLILELMEKTNR